MKKKKQKEKEYKIYNNYIIRHNREDKKRELKEDTNGNPNREDNSGDNKKLIMKTNEDYRKE